MGLLEEHVTAACWRALHFLGTCVIPCSEDRNDPVKSSTHMRCGLKDIDRSRIAKPPPRHAKH